MARQGRGLFSDHGTFLCKFRLFFYLSETKEVKYFSSISEMKDERRKDHEKD